jgi:signal transduction histidine kinase
MNAYATLPLTAVVLNLLLLIFILLKGRRKRLNQSFAILSSTVMVWNFGYFLMYISPSEKFALLFGRQIIFFGAVFLPPTFLYFLMVLINKFTMQTKIVCLTAFFLSLILFLLNFKGFITNNVVRYSWGYLPVASKNGFLFIFLFIFCNVYNLNLLFKAIKSTSGIKHNQLKYIFLGASIAYGGGITNFLTIHLGQEIAVYPIGNGMVLTWLGIVAYAVYKHHLMDIDVVIKKGAVYAYLSFLVFIPCMFIIIFAQKYFFSQTNFLFSVLALCTLLLASLVILKLKPEIEEYIERKLFKSKFEYKKALRELSEIIISFLDERELFKKAGHILIKDLGTEKISFFLLDKEKKAYTLRASQNLVEPKIRELPPDDPFFHWLQTKKKAVVKDEIEGMVNDPQITSVVKTMESMQSEVCIPLIARGELIGIINLGRKRHHEMYSHEDLDVLTHFAAQASIALENARLYQEMQRTHQLMRRSDRMASLGSLTAGLAHEIRNPLVTIKTFLDLFPQRYKDKEFRGDFLRLTASEVDRINTLITNLLNFARPSKPKFEKADVNQVIKEVITLVAVEAKKKDISIDADLRDAPRAKFDANQMKQVFLNILLNAIDAISAHGSISITNRSIYKKGKEYAQIEIADTGKGIPKKILDSIFDPFFTTKEKGSGLGLAISHQIVQEHKGTIEVESMPKKGTTFSVTIPRGL